MAENASQGAGIIPKPPPPPVRLYFAETPAPTPHGSGAAAYLHNQVNFVNDKTNSTPEGNLVAFSYNDVDESLASVREVESEGSNIIYTLQPDPLPSATDSPLPHEQGNGHIEDVDSRFRLLLSSKLAKMKLGKGIAIADQIQLKCLAEFENRIRIDFKNTGKRWAVELDLDEVIEDVPDAGFEEGWIVFSNDEILRCFELAVMRDRTRHLSAGEVKNMCRTCKWTFSNQQLRDIHQNTHSTNLVRVLPTNDATFEGAFSEKQAMYSVPLSTDTDRLDPARTGDAPQVPSSLLPRAVTWQGSHAPDVQQNHVSVLSHLRTAARKRFKLPPQAPRVNNGPNMSYASEYTSAPGLMTSGGMNSLIAEALEPQLANRAKCSLLLCMFRNKAYDCISTRIDILDPTNKPGLNDEFLWTSIKRAYRKDILTWTRRLLSLKTIKAIRLLHYNATSRPTRIEDETYFTKQDLMYAFLHPSRIKTERDWIDWVFLLKSDPDNRYALEFVEDWDGMRIVHIGVTMLVAIVVAAILWWSRGGDLQTVFTVAAFALAVCTTFVALLAVYSQVDH